MENTREIIQQGLKFINELEADVDEWKTRWEDIVEENKKLKKANEELVKMAEINTKTAIVKDHIATDFAKDIKKLKSQLDDMKQELSYYKKLNTVNTTVVKEPNKIVPETVPRFEPEVKKKKQKKISIKKCEEAFSNFLEKQLDIMV